MSYSINEIVITPIGRGVVTRNLNDEVVSVKIDGNGEDRFRVDEISYETLAGYESTQFYIEHHTGMLHITATPIGYIENGIHKMKFEIMDAFGTNKVYRNNAGYWKLEKRNMLSKYLNQVGARLHEKYDT